jgi:hypothetical protein
MPPKTSGKASKTPSSATPIGGLPGDDVQQASPESVKSTNLRLNTSDIKFRNAPPRGRAFASVIMEDSRVVVFGGWDGGVPATALEGGRAPLPTVEYCVPLSEWGTLAQTSNIPAAVAAAHAASVAHAASNNLTTSMRSLASTRGDSVTSPVLTTFSDVALPNEHPAATQCASTELNGSLYVHGGWTGACRSSTLSTLDLLENRWETLRLAGSSSSFAVVPPLTFHTMCGVGKKLFIYGGTTDGALDAVNATSMGTAVVQQTFNEIMYSIDISAAGRAGGGGECTASVCGQHGAPPKRSSHTATLFSDTYIIIFGGRGGADGSTVLGDIAIFDTTSSTWILNVVVETPGTCPAPRYSHAACKVEGKGVLIHGGIGQDGSLLNDAWLLSMEKPGVVSWRRVASEGTLLTARCGHSLVNITNNTHQVMVLGGRHALPNTLVDTRPAQPTSPTSGGALGGKTSGRVSPPMSNNSSTAPSKRPAKPSAAALAAAAAEAQAALLAQGPLDFLMIEFPEFRPAGTKTPSNASIAGGGHRESISSKVTSIRPHQPGGN